MGLKISEYANAHVLPIDTDLYDVSADIGGGSFQTRSIAFSVMKGALTNLYTANGSLSGNRTVSCGVNDLTYSSTGDANLFKLETTNDRVGIGTAAPSEKVEVVGNVLITGANNGVKIADNNVTLRTVSGFSGLWMQEASPSLTNYSLTKVGATLLTNVPTGGQLIFRENNSFNTAELQEGAVNDHWLKIGRNALTNRLIQFGSLNMGFGIGTGQMQIEARTTDKIALGSYDGTNFVTKLELNNSNGNLDLTTGSYANGGVFGITQTTASPTSITVTGGIVTAMS